MPRFTGRFLRLGLVAGLIGACATGIGCIGTPRQTDLMSQANIRDITSTQLRVKVHGYASHFAGIVEMTAIEIEQASSEGQVKINALLWKMHAIPACQKAALQSDPLAALVDVWTLAHQMTRFFESGAGRDLFGEQQPLALDASRGLQTRIEALARSIARDPEMPRARGALTDWVEENPIESLLFARDSPTPLLADLVGGEKRGAFAVVGSLGESVTDISSRISIYAETMPKQARWQAQLVMEQLVGEDELAESILALRSLTSLEAQLSEAMLLVDDLPGLVAGERELILSVLQAERAILTRFIEEQRLETFEFVQGERAAVLDSVHEQRVETIEELRVERVAIIEEIRSMSGELIDQSEQRAERLIDHLVLRLAQLVVALALIAGLFVLIVVVILRRPRRAAS